MSEKWKGKWKLFSLGYRVCGKGVGCPFSLNWLHSKTEGFCEGLGAEKIPGLGNPCPIFFQLWKKFRSAILLNFNRLKQYELIITSPVIDDDWHTNTHALCPQQNESRAVYGPLSFKDTKIKLYPCGSSPWVRFELKDPRLLLLCIENVTYIL